MMASFHNSEKTSAQGPVKQGLTAPCSWVSTAAFPIQLLGFVTVPGRQEKRYFRVGTAAEIRMEKVLSCTALRQVGQEGRRTRKSNVRN